MMMMKTVLMPPLVVAELWLSICLWIDFEEEMLLRKKMKTV